MSLLKVDAGSYEDFDAAQLRDASSARKARGNGEVMFEERAHGRTIAIVHRSTREGDGSRPTRM